MHISILKLSHFTGQHLCTILCILDHILTIASTCFGDHWHHLQGVQFNCKFLETHQMIISTGWPLVTRSQFVTQHTQLVVIYNLVIIWCVSKNLQLNGPSCRLFYWTPRRVGAIINMCSAVCRMENKCWSIKCLHKQWISTCFGQPPFHLQGRSRQRLDTLRVCFTISNL